MPEHSIYADIASRTGGDIYIGVVGPVRTGKSTLIKKFMEALVIPNIENEYDRTRAKDELPQSAAGRTVMTAEPKFVPDEAVAVRLDVAEGKQNGQDGAAVSARVRFVDCVGYIVPDALGYVENGEPRMVHTPWREEPMPFGEAAEYGTNKVIRDHSTIGLLVTCDGTICDIPRQSYAAVEEKVAAELRKLKKPFAVVLNSADPNSSAAIELALSLEKKYSAPVALVNCLQLNADDVRHILGQVLMEFPLNEVRIDLPSWVSALPREHWLVRAIDESVDECAVGVGKMGEVSQAFSHLAECEYISSVDQGKIDLATGKAEFTVSLPSELYYKILSELTGLDIGDDETLIKLMKTLSETKKKYDRVASALDAVAKNGYGIVLPDDSDLKLEDPKLVKQSGGWSVKLKASAPSIHMIKADIEAEVNPIVGSETQARELLNYISDRNREDPEEIWQTNMFGRTLGDLVNDGINSKLSNMPDDARAKMSDTLSRIVNEGSGGLICIIL